MTPSIKPILAVLLIAGTATTALAAGAGKATEAEFEHGKQGPAYEVEVVSGSKVFDVRGDADRGSVILSREDKLD